MSIKQAQKNNPFSKASSKQGSIAYAAPLKSPLLENCANISNGDI